MELDANQYLIDANIIVGLLDSNDHLHNQIRSLKQKIVVNGIHGWIFDYVVQEVMTVFLYKSANHLVKRVIPLLHTDPLVTMIDCPIFWLHEAIALAEDQKFQPKMSATDWLLLSRSLVTGVPILTFDQQLLTASKKLS